MIKTISSTGRYMTVAGGYPSNTYINTSSGMGAGNIRYDSGSGCMEVYDGYSWIQLSMANPMVGLTGEAESLLDWARQKRTEELELKNLAETNPAIADLIEQKNTIEHKIKMVQALVKDHTNAN